MEYTQTRQDASSRFETMCSGIWTPDLNDGQLVGPPLTTPTDDLSYALTDYNLQYGNVLENVTNGVIADDTFWSYWWSDPSPDPLWSEQLPASSSGYTPQSSISSTPCLSLDTTTPDSHLCQAELPLIPQLPVYQPAAVVPISRVAKKTNSLGPRNNRSKISANRSDAITLDPNMKQDANNNGVLILGKRKRSRLNKEDRKATALTRSLGACEKCRRQKVRCGMPANPFTPCRACLQSSTPRIISSCIRAAVLDINLFRLGSTYDDSLRDWTRRQSGQSGANTSDVVRYLHPVRKLLITQDLGLAFEVTVAQFKPGPGDPCSYKWKDAQGNRRRFPMPPYCMIDMVQADQDMQLYCEKSYRLYIEQLLDASNPIVRQTFEFACNHTAGKSTLVSNALRIWAATRLTERPWRICGDDTLGVDPSNHSNTPWESIVPVTPIMDTQLDDLVFRSILLPAQKRVLAELDHKLRFPTRNDWFEIFLFMFIMMSNFEFIFDDMIEYADRHGIDGTPRGRRSLNESYILACKTLLSYFHFAYNGRAPLAMNWDKPTNNVDDHNTNYGVFDVDQRQYMQRLRRDIAQQSPHFATLKDVSMYSSTPMYWCHQLLSEDWRADLPNDGSTREFTEMELLTW